MTNYSNMNHGMLSAFVERWHSNTSSFHLSHGDMSITLNDVIFMLHLSIRGRLLDHSRIIKDEAFEMMVVYLGANSGKA